MTWTNWVGNQSFSPATTATPRDEDEVVALVRAGRRARSGRRVAGAGHSFTPVVQTDGLLLDVSAHARRRRRPTRPPGARRRCPARSIRDFYEPLWDAGLALRNQGDIDTQQIAGAVATGTHGSGTRYTSLSGVVRGVRLVTATGDVREIGEDEPDLLHAAQVSVGMLGVVTQLELEVTDAYRLREHVEPALVGRRDGAAGTSSSPSTATSACSGCRPRSPARSTTSTAHGAAARGPVLRQGLRRGRPRRAGRRHRRPPGRPLLPDLPDGLRPELPRAGVLRRRSTGRPEALARDARADAAAASPTPSTRSRCGRSAPTRRSSRPQYRTPTVVISVSGTPGTDYWAYLRSVDALLADFDARVHWGKLHFLTPERLHALYPRAGDFVALRRELDPDGHVPQRPPPPALRLAVVLLPGLPP